MFTLSRADAFREMLFDWRIVTAAGAAALCALSFALGLAVAPVLA